MERLKRRGEVGFFMKSNKGYQGKLDYATLDPRDVSSYEGTSVRFTSLLDGSVCGITDASLQRLTSVDWKDWLIDRALFCDCRGIVVPTLCHPNSHNDSPWFLFDTIINGKDEWDHEKGRAIYKDQPFIGKFGRGAKTAIEMAVSETIPRHDIPNYGKKSEDFYDEVITYEAARKRLLFIGDSLWPDGDGGLWLPLNEREGADIKLGDELIKRILRNYLQAGRSNRAQPAA